MQTRNSTKKTMPHYTNPRNKYKSRRTHNNFTNTLITIAKKIIPKATISNEHNKPWFRAEGKDIRERQGTFGEILNKPFIRKSK